MPINEVHARVGNAALLFMLIAGIWGLIRWARQQGIDANYFGVLVVGELLVLAQWLLGAYMWLGLGRVPASSRPWMHYLYGTVAALALPAVYAYTRGQTEDRRHQALYGLVCLFVAAIVFRATMVLGS
ncbi:MAG: hypothetical protein D6775_06875 [Caldilineae bacterium]|nr:MAG: hypothetical protein D6775_06875 [Caldilineae bacterium]